jgi:type I restriction enzyme S subunit
VTLFGSMRVKYLAKINLSTLPEDTDPDCEIHYLDISSVGLGQMQNEPEILAFAAAPSRARRLVQDGDTIVSTVRTYLRAVLPIRDPHSSLVVSTGFAVLTPESKIDPRYFAWVIQSDIFIEEVVARSVGVSYPGINASQIGDIQIPITDLQTQGTIAYYLNRETARIDALIEKKKRMIDVLRERQVVSESTSALAAGSQTTPIPSIPTVPAEWKVLRNKVFMREVNAPSFDGMEEMLSVSHLTGVTPRSEKTVNMFEAESTAGYKMVQPGDLVINTMWAWMGAAGVARVPGIVSPAYGVYRIDPTIMTPDYFDIVVRTSAYITEMTRYSRGVTSSRLRLYPDEFLSLSSPVPPREEQRRIVERCFAERVRTTTLVERLERQIKLLRKHRQALITAAVTGELEIPEVAA